MHFISCIILHYFFPTYNLFFKISVPHKKILRELPVLGFFPENVKNVLKYGVHFLQKHVILSERMRVEGSTQASFVLCRKRGAKIPRLTPFDRDDSIRQGYQRMIKNRIWVCFQRFFRFAAYLPCFRLAAKMRQTRLPSITRAMPPSTQPIQPKFRWGACS